MEECLVGDGTQIRQENYKLDVGTHPDKGVQVSRPQRQNGSGWVKNAGGRKHASTRDNTQPLSLPLAAGSTSRRVPEPQMCHARPLPFSRPGPATAPQLLCSSMPSSPFLTMLRSGYRGCSWGHQDTLCQGGTRSQPCSLARFAKRSSW